MSFFTSFSNLFSQSEEENSEQKRFQETLNSFNDPIVRKVSWLPLQGGGKNFQTHNLVQNEQGNLEFKVSFAAMFFSMIPIFIGIIGLSSFLPSMIISVSSTKFDYTNLVPVILFSIPTIVGIFMLKGFWKKRIFDFQTGYFSIGKIPENNFDGFIAKNMTLLRNVRAIQVVGENCSGSKGSRYRSYEINLVLKDASRVNVIDHGNLSQILLDAQQIATRLSVPMWNVSSFWKVLDDNPSIDPIGEIEDEDDKNIKPL